MRESIAALALIRRIGAGGTEWLTQWNDRWEAFHLIGGQKEDETFRHCCAREVAEELGLVEGVGFRVADEPAAHLEYVAYSRSARVETRYVAELFDVELLGDAADAVARDPANRWVTTDEITAERCRDGRRVSETTGLLLGMAGLLAINPGIRPAPRLGVVQRHGPPSTAPVGVTNMPEEPIAPVSGGGPQVIFLRSVRNDLSDAARQSITERLRRLYHGAEAVVVIQLHRGFNPGPEQFIQLVEVHGGKEGRYIVKLDTPAELEKEWKACLGCRISFPDKVLLTLTRLPAQAGPVEGLEYTDGNSFLRGKTMMLEDAFLDAVRFGSPRPSSVRDTLLQLYERLQSVLYEEASHRPTHEIEFVVGPGGMKLEASLRSWRTEPYPKKARLWANSWADQKEWRFRDPVDYLSATRQALAPDADRDFYVPGSLLVGRAHGDLHGRNVLVGIDSEDCVHSPVVFDFEHMGPGNLIAWDFVKMETELKVRAYAYLYHGLSDRELIQHIQAFELTLAAATNAAPRADVDDAATSPEHRLRSLLLALRGLAKSSLAGPRPDRWLSEWYFALACYGVHVGRFQNLDQEHFTAAYISAGVAVGQLRRLNEPDARLPAKRGSVPPPPAEYDVDAAVARVANYNDLLPQAIAWRSHGEPGHVDQAAQLLGRLYADFQYALPVGTELVLALFKQGKMQEGKVILERLEGKFKGGPGEEPDLDEEAWCLFGRFYKNQGYEDWKCSAWDIAADSFEAALKRYEAGYQVRRNHFPGINTAALLLFLAAVAHKIGDLTRGLDYLRRAQDRARELAAQRWPWPELREDDEVWHRATRGEIHLILGEGTEAERWYRDALAPDRRKVYITDDHKSSSGSQAHRLLQAWAIIGLPAGLMSFSPKEIFGVGPP